MAYPRNGTDAFSFYVFRGVKGKGWVLKIPMDPLLLISIKRGLPKVFIRVKTASQKRRLWGIQEATLEKWSIKKPHVCWVKRTPWIRG